MRLGPADELPPLSADRGSGRAGRICPDEPEFGKARDGEKVRKLRTLMRSAFKSARSQNKEMVETAHDGLEIFVKENSFNRHPRLWATPLENYLIEQVYLTADGLLRRMRTETLTFLDVREDLANLMSLSERIAHTDNDSATVLSIYLRAVLAIIAPVAFVLEKLTRVQCTNWDAVYDSIPGRPRTATERTGRTEEKQILVPSLANLTKCRLLGTGGFGTVYKVNFCDNVPMTCKLVAAHKLKKERVRCADKLVACVAKSHLLVKFHASFQVDAGFVSLMEYIRGVDVHRILKTQCYIPLHIIRILLAQLCLAVQFLHMTGFIHRDIKPSNIMMMPNCRIRLIDFDTCKVCSANFLERTTGSFVRKTFAEFRDGQSSGTLHYLAPEVLKKRFYGRAMDWWSIGVTAFLFGAGTLPFHGKDDKIVRGKIVSSTPNIDFDLVLDTELRSLVRDWLQKRPLDRLTGHQMSSIMGHPFFEYVNWKKILERNSSLGKYKELQLYFVVDDRGRFTPRSDTDTWQTWRRPILDLEELKDQREHIPLYTFVSSGMQQVLRSIDDDEPVLEACDDTSEPISNINSLDLTCSQNETNYFKGFSLPQE